MHNGLIYIFIYLATVSTCFSVMVFYMGLELEQLSTHTSYSKLPFEDNPVNSRLYTFHAMNGPQHKKQKAHIDINDLSLIKQFDRDMFNRLYSYQKETVLWVLDEFKKSNATYSINDFKPNKINRQDNFDALRGVLIGHSMGLGKTPISCSLLQILFSHKAIRYAIIIVPKSLIEQWANEIPKWCNVSVFKYIENREQVLKQFLQKQCAIMLTTYKIVTYDYLILQNEINKSLSARQNQKNIHKHENVQQYHTQNASTISPIDRLIQQQITQSEYPYRHVPFDLMILEEATFIKNDQTQAYKALNNIDAFFKIALTGTPIINNLTELYTLINFLHPGFLGAKVDFKQFYSNNIEYSKMKDVAVCAKYCGRVLKEQLMEALKPIMIRYTKENLKLLEVQKSQIIIWSDMPAIQREIMLGFIKSKSFKRQLHDIIHHSHTPFKYIMSLRKICDHVLRMYEPDFELINSEKDFLQFVKAAQQVFKNRCPDIELVLSLNNNEEEENRNQQYLENGTSSIQQTSEYTSFQEIFNCNFNNNIPQAQGGSQPTINTYQPQLKELEKIDKQLEQMDGQPISNIIDILNRHMGIKYSILLTLIKYFVQNKLKTLIFTEHTTSLDILSFVFRQANIRYYRFDGKITKTSERQNICESFQTSEQTFILMMTSRVGSYGLNLQSARRIIIFGPSWNMTVEEQAIGRAYRLGQKQNVLVYKLVQRYTIEEKLLARQLHKFQISNVTGDQGAILKAKQNDIRELFNFAHFEANSGVEEVEKIIQELKQKQENGLTPNENQLLHYYQKLLNNMMEETAEKTCKRLFGEISNNLEDIALIKEMQNSFPNVNIQFTNMMSAVDQQFSQSCIVSDDDDCEMCSERLESLRTQHRVRDNGVLYTIVTIDQLRKWRDKQNNPDGSRHGNEKMGLKDSALLSKHRECLDFNSQPQSQNQQLNVIPSQIAGDKGIHSEIGNLSDIFQQDEQNNTEEKKLNKMQNKSQSFIRQNEFNKNDINIQDQISISSSSDVLSVEEYSSKLNQSNNFEESSANLINQLLKDGKIIQYDQHIDRNKYQSSQHVYNDTVSQNKSSPFSKIFNQNYKSSQDDGGHYISDVTQKSIQNISQTDEDPTTEQHSVNKMEPESISDDVDNIY